ncbi:MAG: hypothetical protein IJB25_13690 [Clostridia bacterium]|nr:hypothetical protein [Clostridia bacterium]MBQ4620911.1 hypothetical protein [Clostridia bacterium]
MVIGIFGESCTGKSTLAEKLKDRTGAPVYTGKDYVRLAKNEQIAKKLFEKKLLEAVSGENIIYVISEKEHLALLPEHAYRVLVTADIDLIKERFKSRMRGVLPPPVEMMLQKKHGCFDGEKCDIHMVSGKDSADDIAEKIANCL